MEDRNVDIKENNNSTLQKAMCCCRISDILLFCDKRGVSSIYNQFSAMIGWGL